MSPAPAKNLPSRVLDIVFGKKLEGRAAERARAERPPQCVERIIGALYLAWFLLFILWGIGKLGWVPEPRETFTTWWLIPINGYGVVVQWIGYGVDRYYRAKARRASKSVALQ